MGDSDQENEIPGSVEVFDEAEVVENLRLDQMDVVRTPSPVALPSLGLVVPDTGDGGGGGSDDGDPEGGGGGRHPEDPDQVLPVAEPIAGCSKSSGSKKRRSTDFPKKPKGPHKIRLLEDKRMRGRAARERGNTLKRLAGEFKILTGGSVHLHAKFKPGGGKEMEWRFPETTLQSDESREASFAEPASSAESSARAIAHELAKSLRTILPVYSSPVKQGTSTADVTQIFSPAKRTRVTGRAGSQKCVICFNSTVMVGSETYDSGWLGCSFGQRDAPCPAWAHTYCVGFVGLNDEKEIEKSPDWYCSLHRAQAIQQRNTTPAADTEEPAAKEPAAKKPAAKKRGGKRK